VTAWRARVAVVQDDGAALAAVDITAALPACTIVTADDEAHARPRFSVATLRAALAANDVLLLDLADAASLRRVVDAIVAILDASTPVSGARLHPLVIDVSPVAPDVSRECAERLDVVGAAYAGAALVRRGMAVHVAYADAGVSEEAFALLGCIADRVLSVGDAGSAKLVRILDATMAAVNAAATAEALGVVSRMGLSDTEVVARISLGSGAHAGLGSALDGDDGPTVDRACDDINMALELGRVHRRSMFFASTALSAMRGSSGMGLGNEPLRAVRQWFQCGATRRAGALT
jgi:3-hydroxyisobutyrate dehydrogenase-like beta-hydroxyacid dehydrogenase